MTDNFKKVLIIERSEMGIRALDVCLELGLGFVVGFSAADKDSFLVRKALAASAQLDGSGIAYLGAEVLNESYANVANIIQTAKLWGCDSVYPGYGPLAEDAGAVSRFEKAGLKFIGPNSKIVEIFSHRFKARQLAQKNGFALLPAFKLTSSEDLGRIFLAEKIEFPFLLKAFVSGGGKGNFFIKCEQDLSKFLKEIDLKSGRYYAEQYISGKHIELQFVADAHGVRIFGSRDCSCQLNFQKFLEECPAVVNEKKRKELERKTIQMLSGLKYHGVGTIEFLFDIKGGQAYFLEINPRIQVEAPITELFSGENLVKMQFLIALGRQIIFAKKKIAKKHFIQARIYARDIYKNFKQNAGRLEKIELPDETSNLKIFTGYQTGDILPASYEPLILKIVSGGNCRKTAILNLKKALRQLQINGLATNRELILWLLDEHKFKKNQITQDFTALAWEKQLANDRIRARFLAKGSFVEHVYRLRMNSAKFPNKLCYEKNGVQRVYLEELKAKQQKNGKKCAFSFGVFEKAGVQCVFAWWDFAYFGGTLGVDEAFGVEECFKLADKKKLPVLMISESGGARQQENAFALQAMHFVLAVRKKYEKIFFVNIYFGDNFGGLNASLLEQADVKIAVKGSRIGLAGPRFSNNNILTESGTLEIIDSVKEHYRARNLDLSADNFEEACEKALSLFGLLSGVGIKGEIKNEKKEREGNVALNFNDILQLNMAVFDEIFLLGNQFQEDQEVLAIGGALARIGKQQLLVLGQFTQLVKGENSKKKYPCPNASDFAWFRKKLKLAAKLQIPVLLFGDTRGADASTRSEYEGINYQISQAIKDQLDLAVPIVSVNMGLCGSGGGLPFVNTADFAIAFEHSLKMVSDIAIQSAILFGTNHATLKQQTSIMPQLNDATAKVQKKYFFVDKIIPEIEKKKMALLLREEIVKGFEKITSMDIEMLKKKRLKRIRRVLKTII